MSNILTFFLVVYCTAVMGRRPALDRYWIFVKDEHLQEYRQNGRSCGECHLPFSHEDELYYGCLQHEYYGQSCKNSAGVFIRCPEQCPIGSAKFFNLVASSGADDNSVVLECKGTGSPNPTITFKKNGEVVDVIKPSSQYPVVVNASITLRYNRLFYGAYSCHLDNGYSTASSDETTLLGTYTFFGERLPTIPTNLRVLSQFRSHVTLGWDYDEQLPSDYKHGTSYAIHMRPGRPHTAEKLDVVLIRAKTYTIKHLEPGVKYSFKVKRVNNYGSGLYSEPAFYTLPENAPVDRPVNVTVTDVDSFSVSLRWDFDGEEEESNGYRQITFSPGRFNANQSSTQYFNGDSKIIEGLLPNTKYMFEVQAVVAYVYVRKAEPVYVTTKPQAASIKSLRVDNDDHNVVRIICKMVGGPRPQVSWRREGDSLQDDSLVNTTVVYDTVTSVLTLPRTAFIYTQYTCEGSNTGGNDTRSTTVRYEGDHPPVALEKNVMNIYEYLREMKEDLHNEMGEMKEGIGNELKKIKEDLEVLKRALSV